MLQEMFEVKFTSASLLTVLDEEQIINEIYTNAMLYDAIGKEMCTCIDIGIGKGGTESIVESFYSSMKAQTKPGGQITETLALRKKLEWSIPPVIQADSLVQETAKMYISGDKKKGYPAHKWPIIGDVQKRYRVSKVVDRIAAEHAQLPYLV